MMKKTKHKVLMIVVGWLCCMSIAQAALSSELNNLFDELGDAGNATRGNAYQGQNAGYYTGGSLYVRNPVRTVQLASLTLPSYRAGCGGIDFFTGGFSFLNSEELETMMRNIINNAASYAFMLAMKSITPQISSVMEYAEKLANEVNQANLNSCETGAALVGSLWPRTQIAQKQVCETIGTSKGIFDGWAAARQGCNAGGQQSEISQAGKNDPAFKELVLDNTNIVWEGLRKNSLFSGDQGLAEFFMSLSGTVIVYKEGEGDEATNKTKVLPGLATDQTLLRALLHGGETKIYRCDEEDACLRPEKRRTTVNDNASLIRRVSNMLDSIVQKIQADTGLSDEEKGLLNATRLPVYKMLDVQVAFAKGGGTFDVGEYADVIAMDLLFRYLTDSLDVVKSQTANLMYPHDRMEQVFRGIETARAQVREEAKSAYRQVSLSVQLIKETQTLERMLAGELSTSLSNNLTWARSMG